MNLPRLVQRLAADLDLRVHAFQADQAGDAAVDLDARVADLRLALDREGLGLVAPVLVVAWGRGSMPTTSSRSCTPDARRRTG